MESSKIEAFVKNSETDLFKHLKIGYNSEVLVKKVAIPVFHALVYLHQAKRVDKLLSSKNFNVNQVNLQNQNAFLYLLENFDLNTAQVLVKHKINLNHPMPYTNKQDVTVTGTILELATIHLKFELATFLLGEKTVNVNTTNIYQKHLLYTIIDWLADVPGNNTNIVTLFINHPTICFSSSVSYWGGESFNPFEYARYQGLRWLADAMKQREKGRIKNLLGSMCIIFGIK